jgi:hypothetical protein
VTERTKSSHEPASAGEPIVSVIDDDASVRVALCNHFQSVVSSRRLANQDRICSEA